MGFQNLGFQNLGFQNLGLQNLGLGSRAGAAERSRAWPWAIGWGTTDKYCSHCIHRPQGLGSCGSIDQRDATGPWFNWSTTGSDSR
ncbi:hypothetical protein PGN35_021320 [Nodosilinea sp. PGN35]|uniref:hypothetical protein n=1 Tax=Nodosilinea sp. PGN35 TaxID=3020489 RepID=UPI00351D910F